MNDIVYHIKRFRRSKHLRLRVKPDGSVLVTAPTRIAKRLITRFVETHRDWIEKHRRDVVGDVLHHSSNASPKPTKEQKAAALALVTERLNHWNQFYNFSWKKVGIRNQSTRWGSCSRTGNLSFNYRVITLPVDLVDYLVVHELCHTKEMNHSVKFWNLVKHTVPDAAEKRKALHRHDLHRSHNEQRWSVYILQCADGTLYTGIAHNIDERLKKHNAGTGAKYTKGRGPSVVVWRENDLTEGDARRREVEIKKMNKEKKNALVNETKRPGL